MGTALRQILMSVKPNDKVARLTVLAVRSAPYGARTRLVVDYRCDCGTLGTCRADQIGEGPRKQNSCGCQKVESASRVHRVLKLRYGGRAITRDGKRKDTTYTAWRSIVEGCRGNGYYAQRGIGHDPRWSSFDAFLADMGDRPNAQARLTRLDKLEDFGPKNCVWGYHERGKIVVVAVPLER